VVPLTEKREGPEHPYRVVDRSDANFRESPFCEVASRIGRRSPAPILLCFLCKD
jgi:hypothetical protein